MAYDILFGDNLTLMDSVTKKFSLIVTDPPFNTGIRQERTLISTRKSEGGERKGFGDNSYEIVSSEKSGSYDDTFEDYESFIMPRLKKAWSLLTDNGSLMIHLDQREVHYVKVWMDKEVGRDKFIQEVIWTWDYGARSKKKWSVKHNTILWYAKNHNDYIFNFNAIDRIPYMTTGLVSAEKQKIGKTPTSCFFMTIVPTNSKEKTGYASQKPEHLLRRIIRVHSNPGDNILDIFGGSGTTGAVALQEQRNAVVMDSNPESIAIMKKRFQKFSETEVFLPVSVDMDAQLKSFLEEEDEEAMSEKKTVILRQSNESTDSVEETLASPVLKGFELRTGALVSINSIKFYLKSVMINDKYFPLTKWLIVEDHCDYIYVESLGNFRAISSEEMIVKINRLFQNLWDFYCVNNTDIENRKKFFGLLGL